MKTLLIIIFSCLTLGSLSAQSALSVSANKTTAAIGEDIMLTVAVSDAPAFSSWGATIDLRNSFSVVDQAKGDLDTFVPDSRSEFTHGLRFGGYAHSDHAAGSHVLAKITIRATHSGTFTLNLPAYHASNQPFGGLLIASDGTEYVPTATSVTLTITGNNPVQRVIRMKARPNFDWTVLAPLDAIIGPVQNNGMQPITVSPEDDTELVSLPITNT